MLHLLAAATLLTLPQPTAAPDQSQDPKRPNIVFILVDDLGYTDLGVSGTDFYETPNIDRLAAQGTFFERAYVQPNCAPTRATLMTGLYPPRHGVYTVSPGNRGKAENRKLDAFPNQKTLAPEFETMGEMLQSAGYRTGFVGKWHLGSDEASAAGRGFEFTAAGNEWGHPRSYFSPYQHPTLPDGPEGEYLTDRMTDEAVKFLRGDDGRPMFLCLWYYSVHTPIQPRPDLEAKFAQKPKGERHKNPKYAAMVSSVDQGVGRVMDTLADIWADQNTLVVFMSDNGGLGGYDSVPGLGGSGPTTNAPLKGGKGQFYEGGVRTPMIVRWLGGGVPGGKRSTVRQHAVDLKPTFANLAQAESKATDGYDMTAVWKGEKDTWSRPPMYWNFPGYLGAYGAGIWRITPSAMIIDNDWKLIETYETGDLELYNLNSDPSEKQNLAAQNPETRDELLGKLHQWQQSTKAPRARPKPN